MKGERRMNGGCHCGAIEVEVELSREPGELEVRACSCSFCRRHGASTISDPRGRVRLRAREPAELGRYRFGPGTADFLVCRRCGVYVAAVMPVDAHLVAIVNINVLAGRERFAREAAPVDYSAESADQRIARRRANWTPALWADDAAPPQPPPPAPKPPLPDLG